MVPPTGTQTEHGNLSQKRCDLKNVGFGGGYHIYIIYTHYTFKKWRCQPIHNRMASFLIRKKEVVLALQNIPRAARPGCKTRWQDQT